MARYSVSISIEPTIALPKYPIETGQTKDSIERPCPPDLPCHIKVGVGTRFQFSSAGQYPYVVQQILLQNLQAAVNRSGLQVFNCEAPPFHDHLPQVNPAKTKPASTVVKYPALARKSGFRFVIWQSHWTLLPLKTVTSEPSAKNAQSGGRFRTVPSSLP